MASKLFKRGYEAARQEIKEQEARSEGNKYNLWQLFLTEGDDVRIRFLTEEPLNLHTHTVKRRGKYVTYRCCGDECALCDDSEYASFKGAYLVYDYREWEDRKGKKHSGNLRLYLVGTRVLSQLDRLHTKYGLNNRDYIISRAGSDKSTTYMFDRQDEEKLTSKKIKQMLGDLAEEFNGTEDSLYEILDKVLMASLPISKMDTDEEDNRSSKRAADDDDDFDEEVGLAFEDDGEDDDLPFKSAEDDEEDDYPSQKPAKKSSKKTMFKRRK